MNFNLRSRNIEEQRYDLKAQYLTCSSILAESHLIYHSPSPSNYSLPFLSARSYILPLLPSCNVGLELGCGTGLHTIEYANYLNKLYAVDISSKSLKLLSSIGRPNIYPITASIDQLPVPSSSIDVVFCFGSMSYAKPQDIFDEVQRVLRPGGFFIVVDTLSGNPFYSINRFIHLITGNRVPKLVGSFFV